VIHLAVSSRAAFSRRLTLLLEQNNCNGIEAVHHYLLVDAEVVCFVTAICCEEIQSLSIILGNGKLNEFPKLWLQNS
jgi:hypothetical protein